MFWIHTAAVKFFVFIHLLAVQLSGNIMDQRLNRFNYANSYLTTSIKVFKIRN